MLEEGYVVHVPEEGVAGALFAVCVGVFAVVALVLRRSTVDDLGEDEQCVVVVVVVFFVVVVCSTFVFVVGL